MVSFGITGTALVLFLALVSGGLIYIAGNVSRLRSERMHHGPRLKHVHANNKTLMNTYIARKCQMISQMDTCLD